MSLTRSTVMLVVLRVARAAPADVKDCVRHLRDTGHEDEADLEDRVTEAVSELSIAGLLDPDSDGRCTLTERGAAVLRDHPKGVDDSVLEQFSEYRAYLREPRSPQDEPPRAHVVEPKAEYLEGVAAFQKGVPLDANPYSPESRKYGDWRDGWSEALITAPAPRSRD